LIAASIGRDAELLGCHLRDITREREGLSRFGVHYAIICVRN